LTYEAKSVTIKRVETEKIGEENVCKTTTKKKDEK
jgi:hypothetical protein